MKDLIVKLGIFTFMCLPILAWGHAQLLVEPPPSNPSQYDDPTPEIFNSPLPRADSNNVRMKDILPCGGFGGEPPHSVKGEALRTYSKEETVRVHWKETNDHTGVWRFDISYDNDKTWNLLLNMKDGGTDVREDDQLSVDSPAYYWADIKLPDAQCENCTFRMTQSMGAIDDGNDYFTCADIKIK